MKWWNVLGKVAVMAGISSCAFDKHAYTSGQIGCAPDKVLISDEDSSPGSESWTATCDGGDVYYCSLVATAEKSGQLSCHAATQSSAAKSKAQSSPSGHPGPAAGDAVPPEPQDAPKTVAGFAFGASVAESSSVCSAHGYEWQPAAQDHFRCTGVPTSIGVNAVPTLRFCDEKLCAVALDVDAPKAWMKTFAQLNSALLKKYGRPANSKGEPRSNCATESDFEACVMKDGLALAHDWKWDLGARISLRLGAGQSAPNLKIIYVRQTEKEVLPDAL